MVFLQPEKDARCGYCEKDFENVKIDKGGHGEVEDWDDT